jgi:hypothetical protein
VGVWWARGGNETGKVRCGSLVGRGRDGRAVRCRGRRKRRAMVSRAALDVSTTEERSQMRELSRARCVVFLVWRRHRTRP